MAGNGGQPLISHNNWTRTLDDKDVTWGRPMILLDAVTKCRLRQLRLLLDAGISVNSRDASTGQTALIRATYLEDAKLRRICTAMLVNYGAKVKLADHMKRTSLSWACLLGRENSIRIFQSRPELGLNYSSVDSDGNTNLVLACMSGNVNVVRTISKSFYRNRLDVNKRNNQGETALSIAVKQNNKEMVMVLLDIARVINDGACNLESFLAKSDTPLSSQSARYAHPRTAQRKPYCNLPKIFNMYTDQLTNSYQRACKSVTSYSSDSSTSKPVSNSCHYSIPKPDSGKVVEKTHSKRHLLPKASSKSNGALLSKKVKLRTLSIE